MIYLRQNTADQEIPLGYFLDSSDGDTEETGLTIANTDINLWKFGATTLANKNSGGATHISNGIYYAVLDATDTNTLGSMIVFVHVSGALTIKVDCLVLAANVYDSLIAGSDNLQVDTVQVEGSDATDQIRDAVVDDATRIDASALNSLVVSGASTVTISVIDQDSAAIPDVSVQIYNSDLSTLITYGTSDSLGQVVAALDDATYKVKLKKAGYKFTVPETLTVSGDTSDSYSGDSLFFLSDIGTSTLTTRVYEFCFLPGDIPVESVSAFATITSLPEDNGSSLFTGQKIEGIYNEEYGVVYWDIVKGAKVRFVIINFGVDISKTVPSNRDTIRLTDMM